MITSVSLDRPEKSADAIKDSGSRYEHTRRRTPEGDCGQLTWHRVSPLLVRRTRCTDTSALSSYASLRPKSLVDSLQRHRGWFGDSVRPFPSRCLLVVLSIKAGGDLTPEETRAPLLDSWSASLAALLVAHGLPTKIPLWVGPLI